MHWLVAFGFFAFYVCIMLFLKVPTWSFAHEGHWEDSHCEVSGAGHNRTQVCTSHWVPPVNITTICDKRGDLTPACSATRYVDTWLLGYEHMYDGGPFKRSHWCSGCAPDECDLPDGQEKPGWCDSKLDPEGVLSSVPTVLTTWLGLHFGLVLSHYPAAGYRLKHWAVLSTILFSLGWIISPFWSAQPPPALDRTLSSFLRSLVP